MNLDVSTQAIQNDSAANSKEAHIKTMPSSENDTVQSQESHKHKKQGFGGLIRKIFKKNDNDIREALADYIDENEDETPLTTIERHERDLIGNVLKLRDMTVYDVMIPRVDIIAIDVESTYNDIITLILEKQHSRVPVYRETLDNVIGFVHLKDLLNINASSDTFDLSTIVRDLPILAPSLPALDLIMQMKQTKRHMAVVVDEYGGIDGLVTIEDLTEAIVGEIEDEFDEEEPPMFEQLPDGSIIVDGRLEVEELVNDYKFNLGFSEELHDIDTLAGYITNRIGRVPARGEVLRDQELGITFEIIDADPRRINRIRIRRFRKTHASAPSESHKEA